MNRIETNTLLELGHKPTSLRKVIMAKCLDCVCNQKNEIKLCTAVKCPLHPYRLGKNPLKQKKERSDVQKANDEKLRLAKTKP